MLCGLAAACGRDQSSLTIAVDSVVTIAGVTDSSRVRVSVAGDTTAIAGRMSTRDGALVFRPAFPFDPGRDYEVRVAMPSGASSIHGFRLPAPSRTPSTRVTRVLPSVDTIPENQLRIYIEFSAPMSRAGALPYVRLLDDRGVEVQGAFLPLEADFWNREHTRYTLFLDPGRVKRGILPNEQSGRALVAGRRYAVVVDSAWRDGEGQPLVASYRREFVAGPADYAPIRLDAWNVGHVQIGSRNPVHLRFSEPLDHALLLRAVGIEDHAGSAVPGQITVLPGERHWRFEPFVNWSSGPYRVVVLDFLEDLAGNRVNRPFEVDRFERVDSTATSSRFTIPLRSRGGRGG